MVEQHVSGPLYLCPSLGVSQAEMGLAPRERKARRELAREAWALFTLKVSLMLSMMRPKFPVKQVRRTLSMKVETTRVQARQPSGSFNLIIYFGFLSAVFCCAGRDKTRQSNKQTILDREI